MNGCDIDFQRPANVLTKTEYQLRICKQWLENVKEKGNLGVFCS